MKSKIKSIQKMRSELVNINDMDISSYDILFNKVDCLLQDILIKLNNPCKNEFHKIQIENDGRCHLCGCKTLC